MFATKHGSIGRLLSLTAASLFLAALAGCAGEDGSTGPAGPGGGSGGAGPVGPPGPSGTLPLVDTSGVSSVKFLTARVTSVTVPSDGRPVINFTLSDENGVARRGLASGAGRVVIARLYPGTSGGSSEWRAYTNARPSAGTGEWNALYGTAAGETQLQATAEQMTTPGLVDNGNGTYTYRMTKNITAADANDPGAPAYNPTLTHRVGFEFRVYRNAAITGCATGDTTCSEDSIYIASSNGVYNWRPSDGATTGILTRDIGSNTACDACHDQLNFHGGARSDVQYCVTCHNPYTTDPQTRSTADMKVMVHKIHAGVSLINDYTIYGYGGTKYDFNEIVFPQDLRNCQTCHRPGVTDAPDASNWRMVVNKAACGTCHDGDEVDNPATTTVNENDPIDFYVDAGGNIQGGHITATDAECAGCHGPNAQVFEGGKWMTEAVHFDPEERVAANYRFEVVKIAAVQADGSPGATACTVVTGPCRVLPGEFPLVSVRVRECPSGWNAAGTSCANGSTPTAVLLTDPEFTSSTSTRLNGRVAWTTRNFTNPGSNVARGLPIAIDYKATTAAPVGAPPQAGGAAVYNAADGTYTKAASRPMPASAVGGSGMVVLEGRLYVPVFKRPSDAAATLSSIPVRSSAGMAFGFTDATPVARRAIVDTNKCNDCHYNLSFHGGNRNSNEDLCATCHNPEFTPSPGSAIEGRVLANAGPLYTSWDAKRLFHVLHTRTGLFWNSPAEPITYPGKLNNCEGCHRANTYYPVDPVAVFATSIHPGADQLTPADDTAITPNAAVCSSCHNSSLARTHMEQNGSSFAATKSANGSSNGTETCALCHGSGQTADVKRVHRIGEYRYN